MALCIYGWTYVNLVTLKRKDPFTSGNGGYHDFKILLMTAPILFLASGVMAMRSRHDLSGYCSGSDQDEASNAGHKTHMLRESLLGDDDATAPTANSEEFVGCYEYTDDEIFNWNFNYWTVGFILFGIQFSHIDIGPM